MFLFIFCIFMFLRNLLKNPICDVGFSWINIISNQSILGETNVEGQAYCKSQIHWLVFYHIEQGI